MVTYPPRALPRREAGRGPGNEATGLPCFQSPEEVGHAYGRARNAVSRMVSKHCKISVVTALEVRLCTCPVAGTRSCRSIILGSRIVEMGPYCSCVSVALGSQNLERDKHDPEDGTLNSCCIVLQSRKTADSSDVHL